VVETVLVKADLTPDKIAAGRELLSALDAHGLNFEAALWLLGEESFNWHLVLSNRSVRTQGSLALYHKINKILSKLGSGNALWIGDISIVDQRAPLVQSLRKALGTSGSVDGIRLDSTTIEGVWIPAAMVYRMSAKQRLRAQNDEPAAAALRRA
jgi:hypothetical protein